MAEDLVDKAEEISQGRLGESNKMPDQKLSVLDKALAAQEATTKMLEKIETERVKIEKIFGDMIVSGRGFAGQPNQEPTQADKDKSRANEIIKRFKGY